MANPQNLLICSASEGHSRQSRLPFADEPKIQRSLAGLSDPSEEIWMEAKGAKRLGEEENGRSEILVWKKTNAQPAGASVVKVQASLVGLGRV